MFKQASIYTILLLALISLAFFLSTYYTNSESDQIKDQNLNIFQAKDISLKLNFFSSDFDITLKSKMINGLTDSKILDIFNPTIYLKNTTLEVEIISESSKLNYGTEELLIPNKMSFKGKYLDKPFRGEADQMKFNFLDNRIFFNKDLVIIFDEKEYKGRNIEIDTQLQSIIDSDKITINAVNDFKSR